MKPDIELLLAEADGVLRMLLSKRRTVVYLVYENAIRNTKMLLEFPLRKKLGGTLRVGTSDTCTFSATLLAFTSRTSRNVIPS